MAAARSCRFGGYAVLAFAGDQHLTRGGVRRGAVGGGSHSRPDTAAPLRASSRMVAVDVRRRVSARKAIRPRYLGGYRSCHDSCTNPAAPVDRSRRSCPFKRVGFILGPTNLCLPPKATPLTFGNSFGPAVLTRSDWKRAPISWRWINSTRNSGSHWPVPRAGSSSAPGRSI